MRRPYRVTLQDGRRRSFARLIRAVGALLEDAGDGTGRYVVEHRDAGVYVPVAVVHVEQGLPVARIDWTHLRTVEAVTADG